MDVELLVVPDCPNEDAARQLLRSALDDIGLSHLEFRVTVITGQDEAERRRFTGSPAFLVDGVDLFAEPATPGTLACRIYRSPGSVNGMPALRDLRQELKRAAHRALIRAQVS